MNQKDKNKGWVWLIFAAVVIAAASYLFIDFISFEIGAITFAAGCVIVGAYYAFFVKVDEAEPAAEPMIEV